jgi:hypothetical protein
LHLEAPGAEPDAQVPGHQRGSDLIAGGQRAKGVEQRAWRRVLPSERGVGVGTEAPAPGRDPRLADLLARIKLLAR